MVKPKKRTQVPLNRALNVDGIESVLAVLTRVTYHDLGIYNDSTLFRKVCEYVDDTRNGVPNNIRDRSSVRSNMMKEILSKEMSWKVFCKALRVLNILKFDITITLYHPNGKKTSHTKQLVFSDEVPAETKDE